MIKLVLVLFAVIAALIGVMIIMAKIIQRKNSHISNLESTIRKQNEIVEKTNKIKEEGDELKESFSTGSYSERLDASLAVLSELKARHRNNTDN